jgi:hypothetical protein
MSFYHNLSLKLPDCILVSITHLVRKDHDSVYKPPGSSRIILSTIAERKVPSVNRKSDDESNCP